MGMIRLSKTKKIAIASIAGFVVLLAVVLPLSVGNSDKSSELSANGGNASPTGTGSDENDVDMDTGRTDNVFEDTDTGTGTGTDTGTIITGTEDVIESTGMLAPEIVENCPCFTADSLDNAVTQVASGLFAFNPEKTCTGSATGPDGIFFTDLSGDAPAIMGYAVMDGECRDADVLSLTNAEENASCRELLADKCSQHASVIAADGITTIEKDDGCEHFSAKDLSPVVDQLNAGLITANKNSCQEISIGFGSTLTWTDDGVVREFSTSFDESTGEYKVKKDDQEFITDSKTKNACAAIVDNACKSLTSVKMADGCTYFSKFDMVGIVEAINGGSMKATENSCPEVSIGGSTQTFSWFEDVGENQKTFRTYSASWDESLGAAVVQIDDTVHEVPMEVMSSCSQVIKSACAMIKEKPSDGVISISGGD